MSGSGDAVWLGARRVPKGSTGPDCGDPSVKPLEVAIGSEAAERFQAALRRLCPEERDLIVARVEMGNSYQQIAAAQVKASPDAARMAVTLALVRLAEEMDLER